MEFLNESKTSSKQRTGLRRQIWTVTLTLAISFAQPTVLFAQKQKAQRKAAPVAAVKPAKVDCGGGVELRVNAATPAQGTLVIAEVRSEKALSDVAGKWTNRDISFWQATGASVPKGTNVWRALVGVDLEQTAGDFKFSVTGKTTDGSAVSCEAGI